MKALKIIICIVLIGAVVVLCFTNAKLRYIISATSQCITDVRTGEWEKAQKEAAAAYEAQLKEDNPVIDGFEAGTYGGIKFDTEADVVNYFLGAYEKTKAKTAKYKDSEGNTQTWYAFGGTKEIIISDIKVDGKENSVINQLVPQLLDSLYKPTLSGLQPSMNEDPTKDVDEFGESLLTCRITADDLLALNVADNGDGTITITMQPKLTEMSRVGMDPQGKMFTSLNDLGAVVDAVSVFSWASGTTEENVKVTYKDGTAKITIDVASGEIVKADYNMKAYVSIQHANIAVVHDKSATATVDYNCVFPAPQEFYDKIGIQPLD